MSVCDNCGQPLEFVSTVFGNIFNSKWRCRRCGKIFYSSECATENVLEELAKQQANRSAS